MDKVYKVYNAMLNYMNSGKHSDKEIYEFMINELMKIENVSRAIAIARINKALNEMGVIIPN